MFYAVKLIESNIFFDLIFIVASICYINEDLFVLQSKPRQFRMFLFYKWFIGLWILYDCKGLLFSFILSIFTGLISLPEMSHQSLSDYSSL